MKKAIILFGILLLYILGNAQNPGWAMPENYLKFQNGNVNQIHLPSPPYWYGNPSFPNISNNGLGGYDGYDLGTNAEYTSNMVLDRNGNIRFFIVDGIIYDGEGNFIEELKIESLGIQATGHQETAIIPFPGNCDQYFIVTHGDVNNARIPLLFLLDLSLPNIHSAEKGACDYFGALIAIGSNPDYGLQLKSITPNWFPWAEGSTESPLSGVAVSDLRADNSYLVYVSAYHKIYKYKVDAAGFHSTNSFIALPYFDDNQFFIRSEMELVQLENGNYRIATSYQTVDLVIDNQFTFGVLFLADLDNNGDLIPSSINLFPAHYDPSVQNNQKAFFKGLEFSALGERIYATRLTTNLQPNQLSYFDYNFPTLGLQPLAVPSNIDVQVSQIEMGPNDALYIPHSNGILTIPNASYGPPGPASSFSTFTYPVSNLGYPIQPNKSLQLYLLPDQIDGMDYEAHSLATQQCCINSGTYEAEKYIASSGTWKPNSVFTTNLNPFLPGLGADVYIKNELRIPAGADVKIELMNFHFAPGARVVIENGTGGTQGGKLTLDNTTFTVDNRCADDLWLGIEVWGNTNDAQGALVNSSQGRLILQNNSEVSHAFVGALAGKRTSTFTPTQESCPDLETINSFTFDASRNGGIIVANNANFRDNQRGVFFLPYLASNNANNLSYFKHCQFVWDAPLYGGYSLQYQAQLSGVKGIHFIGSNFENQDAGAFAYTAIGTGIYSYNSQFYVQESCPVVIANCEPCSSPTPSTFLHLRYGIRTNSLSNPLTYTVNRSVFEDCQYGIYTQFTNNSSITENTFDIRQATYQTAGIAMYRTPIYTIQENILRGAGDPSGNLSYGIVVNNTGVENNDIYKNDFEKLHIAVQAEGNNAEEITSNNMPGTAGFTMSGLNYTCNNFNSSIDLADMTIVDGRIDMHQGHTPGSSSMNEAILKTARNRFSLHGEPMALEHDIMVSGPAQQELHYVGLGTPYYFADSYSANWVLSLIGTYGGTPTYATPNMCPSLLCEQDHEELAAQRSGFISELNDLNQEMQNLDPKDDEGRSALQLQIHATQEKIDLIESKIINLTLTKDEDLAVIQTKLLEINKRNIYTELQNLVSQNRVFDPVPAEEIEAFLPIIPTSGGRKVATGTIISPISYSISPNPSNGNMTIHFDHNFDAKIEISVLDLMGKVVYQAGCNAQQSVALDCSNLSNGVYFLLIKSKGEILGNRKIEIQR